MKNSTAILSCFVSLILLGATQNVSAQKTLQNVVDEYISGREDSENATEPAKTRKILRADLDGDGDGDAIVQYMLEGFNGGNNWAQRLAVFRNDRGIYKFANEDSVGGKLSDRYVVLKKVGNRKIYLDTRSCPEVPQGVCDNPKKGRAIFVFRKGKLQEL